MNKLLLISAAVLTTQAVTMKHHTLTPKRSSQQDFLTPPSEPNASPRCTSTCKGKLIFEDNFDTFNFTTWQHEITMSGGGNWEFEYYTNNRTNSFVTDGTLYIQPTLFSDNVGESQMKTGSLSLWGGSPADQCTSNAFYGCERNARASGNYLNPIQSARIRSAESFAFKYGTVEIRAKLPVGDWLWPAIWLLPKNNEFGQWPASGEIDIVESRGNGADCDVGGYNKFGSTLHWGPGGPFNGYEKTTAQHTIENPDDFHVYKLEWQVDGIKTYIDDTLVLDSPFDQDMFTKGEFPESLDNPWRYETEKSAPFNREFYFIFNVAAGGTNGYFPDGHCGKPYSNTDPHASNAFYNSVGDWYPTWNYPATHDSALQIDYVRVYKDE